MRQDLEMVDRTRCPLDAMEIVEFQWIFVRSTVSVGCRTPVVQDSQPLALLERRVSEKSVVVRGELFGALCA